MRDNAKGGALTEVTFFILLSLYTPKHGYAVRQFIEDNTKGRLTLGAGTLYVALKKKKKKSLKKKSMRTNEIKHTLCHKRQYHRRHC